MAIIKQIMQCEPGWEGIYIREDAWSDTPIKTAAAPIIGWALIDDEEGESSVQALLSYDGVVLPAGDLGERYFGAAKPGDYVARLSDFWEVAAQSYIEEFGEPGADQENAGGEGEEGAAEEGAAEEPVAAPAGGGKGATKTA